MAPEDRPQERDRRSTGEEQQRGASTTGMIRGSSLLLMGKVVSVGLGLVIQVLIVRFLSQSDYGAFAFALATTFLLANLGAFGMDKTLARFLPLYEEQGRARLAAGALVLAGATIMTTGSITVVAVLGLQDWLNEVVIGDPLATSVLTVMIVLAPLMAFDSVLLSVFAVLASPFSIFVRRHVVAPLLQLAAVIVVIVLGLGVIQLAVGYVLASLIGLAVYSWILGRLLIERGWLQSIRDRTMVVPARELYGYTAPLMSSDVVFLLTTHLAVVLIQVLRTAEDVALFRAVFPLAQQNLLVMNAFVLLFMPVASRMLARRQAGSLNDLYWQSAIWMTILAFPIFVVTFALAVPVSELLFGAEYAASGPILAWLSLGYFVSAAFGFNAMTLRVYGRVRYIVVADVVTAVIGVTVAVVLINMLGPVGGGIGVAATLLVQNVLYHLGLRKTDIELFPRRYAGVYAAAIGTPMLLVLLIQALQLEPLPALAIGAALAVALPFFARRSLDLAAFFPELHRIPVLRRLIH